MYELQTSETAIKFLIYTINLICYFYNTLFILCIWIIIVLGFIFVFQFYNFHLFTFELFIFHC